MALFLLKYWKLIVIGLAVLGLVTYIGILKHEVTSAKADAEKWHTTYVTYKTNVEANILSLGSANAALTLQLKQSNIARMEADNKARPNLITRITNDQTSAAVRIPAASVQLFNDAARSGSGDIQEPAGTNGGNASNPQPADTDFREVQRVHEIDSHELNLCRQSVKDWNKMWDDFVTNVKARESVSP